MRAVVLHGLVPGPELRPRFRRRSANPGVLGAAQPVELDVVTEPCLGPLGDGSATPWNDPDPSALRLIEHRGDVVEESRVLSPALFRDRNVRVEREGVMAGSRSAGSGQEGQEVAESGKAGAQK